MKTNNKAAREAAARERAKTTSIYNKLADIAREAFDLLTIEPGTYTPAKVAEAIDKSRAFWREAATAWHRDTTAEGIKAERLTAERWKDTPARVEVEGFACQFPRCQVFEILQRFAVSAGVSSAARVIFTRTADEAAAIAEADERAAERARVLADIDRRQREERRREEKREAERKEAARRAARREEIKEKAAEILATASADLLAEYMTDAPALCLATACRDIDINEAAEILAELTAAPADDHQDTDTAEPVSEPTAAPVVAAPAADDLTADELAERLEAEGRRFEAVRRIAARRRALLIRMTTGGRGKTAEAWKFARVTLSAFDEKTVTVWAVGMTETIYTRTYRINKEGRRVEVRHNYTTENTAAAAGWLRSLHRAALLNGWALTVTTARAADVKEADTLARLSQFVPGVDRLADTFERMADSMEAERAAAPAADGHQDTPAEFCPLTGETLTAAPADEMTADEIRAAAAAERERIEREKAEDIARADVETLAAAWHGLTRAEILAHLLTIDTDRAALLLADIDTPQADPVAWLSAADGHQDTTTAEPVSEPTADELAEARRARRRERDRARRAAKRAERERAAAPAADHQDTPAEVISEDTTPAPAADGHQSDSEADALPVTFYDPAAGVIVWGLADELPTADGLTAESVTPADLLAIESERESAAPADGHQDTTTTAHDSESRPRALLLTLTRAALRLAAVVAALLLLTFANDRPTPATATTTAADLLAPADHQDTPAEVISESESADTLTTTPAEVISEPTESEPTARPAADRPAVEKRHHARENKRESRAELMTAATPADLLTADSLTAAAVVISESESQDTTTTARPLLTADELAELLALLTGTTTAESEPTAAPAADDSQDTAAEVISEPTESEPTAAPADGHQDTPATTGTTTPAAPAAGCPAAVATPCPPAAPVAPVAPIIL